MVEICVIFTLSMLIVLILAVINYLSDDDFVVVNVSSLIIAILITWLLKIYQII